MCNLVTVEIINSSQYLYHSLTHKSLVGFDVVHKHSTVNVFHKQKYVILVFKVCVEPNNIGMRQAIVNSQLIRELIDHVIFLDCRFEYLFQGVECPRFFVTALKNITEFSRPDAG
jgi:hypothetical protein